MSLFTKLANTIFSPVDAAGNPRKVDNVDAQRWGTEVESILSAFQAGGGVIFPNKATADTSLNYPPNQMAWVLGDDAPGIYRKIGASGAGSWTRLGDLPYSIIPMINNGAGTANAIVATSSLPAPVAPGAALFTVNIVAANTGSVTINGKPLRTNSGNEIAASGLTAGALVAFLDLGDHYRLLSDQASAAIVAAAEDAANRAEAAAASVVSRAWFKTVANLIAEDNGVIGYAGSGAQYEVATGDIVEAQGFRYEVAASDATDSHVETAGGVKLYVLPLAGKLFATQIALNPGIVDGARVAQFIEIAARNDAEAVFPQGEFEWGGPTADAIIPSGKRCRVTGSSESLTKFTRSAFSVPEGSQQRMLWLRATDDTCEVEVKNITFDGNARENPMYLNVNSTSGFVVGEQITGGTSGASAEVLFVISSTKLGVTWRTTPFAPGETITGGTSSATATVTSALSPFVFEQSECLGLMGGAWRKATVESVHFHDPVADGLNLRGGVYGSLVLMDISESGRRRTRNMVTQNGRHRRLTAARLSGGVMSFETAGSFAGGETMVGTITSSDIVLNLATAVSSGDPTGLSLLVEGSLVRGLEGAGGIYTTLTNCKVVLERWRGTGQGFITLDNCDVHAAPGTTGFPSTDLGTSLIVVTASPIKHAAFRKCRFHEMDSVAKSNIDNWFGFGAQAGWSVFEISGCEFLDPDVRPVQLRTTESAGLFKFTDNDLHYDVSGDANIWWNRAFVPTDANVVNDYVIQNNRIHSSTALLLRFTTFVTGTQVAPMRVAFGGNKRIGLASSTSLYSNVAAANILSPRGSGTRWDIVMVDDFDGDAAPSTGLWFAGTRMKYRVPLAGGHEGAVCTATGSPGTWKEYGDVEA